MILRHPEIGCESLQTSLEISIHRPEATLTKIWENTFFSYTVLCKKQLKKTPGAKSWEPGSNGAVEPGYFEALLQM